MSTFLYTLPNERLFGTVAVETGTTALGGYGAANLDDNLPHKPAKLVETAGAWSRDLGIATRCDFCAVVHHNLGPGVDLRLQGHTSNLWTFPDVDLPFTIPDPHIDGFTKNVWIDLTVAVPLAANRTKQWWRLVNLTSNLAPVIIGEWPMYRAVHNFGIRNISKGSTRKLLKPAILHETELLLRLGFDLGLAARGVEATLESTDTVRAELETLVRAAGATTPITIVPHRDEDEAWFVTLVEPEFSWTRDHKNYNPATLHFIEVTRGQVL